MSGLFEYPKFFFQEFKFFFPEFNFFFPEFKLFSPEFELQHFSLFTQTRMWLALPLDLSTELLNFLTVRELATLARVDGRARQLVRFAWLHSLQPNHFDAPKVTSSTWQWGPCAFFSAERWPAVRLAVLVRLELVDCPEIRHVSVSPQQLPALRSVEVARCARLVFVTFSAPLLRTLRIEACGSLRTLVFFHLDTPLPFQLQELGLDDCAHFEFLYGLELCQQLHTATLAGCPKVVSASGLELQSELRKLTISNLPALKRVAAPSSLLYLDISYTAVRDPELEGLLECPGLEFLSVQGCCRVNYFPADMGRCRSLLRVDASYSGIRSAAGFEQHPNLRSVTARRCSQLRDASAWATCLELVEIDLGRSQLAESVLFDRQPRLTVVNLEAAAVGAPGPARSVQAMLSACTRLSSCFLQRCSYLLFEQGLLSLVASDLIVLDVSNTACVSMGSLCLPLCPSLEILRALEVADLLEFSTRNFPRLRRLELDFAPQLQRVEVVHQLEQLSVRFAPRLKAVSGASLVTKLNTFGSVLDPVA